MSKAKDIQSKTFGSIAAIQTIAENYPNLKRTDSMLESVSIGTSLGYILSLLQILGVTEIDINNWISKLLCGKSIYSDDKKEKALAAAEKAGDGILDVIEMAIKALLFANIKNLFGGCPVEPMLPDWLLEEEQMTIDPSNETGLKVNIAMIDTFGTLKNCPCDEYGSVYYFDTVPTIYSDTYTVNDVYKSSDFNAFLWYVINMSGADGCLWDNRVNVQKDLLSSTAVTEEEGVEIYSWPLREAFFNGEPGKITDTVTNKTITKKNIVRCRYIDTGNITDGDGLIKVTLPSNRYRVRSKKTGFYINRTVFEFNYDYIFSLKLFDSKTLVANILNSMLSLSTTVGVGLTFEQNFVKQKVGEMVRNIMVQESDEDVETVNCANKFSNRQYDSMIKNADMARLGKYQIGDQTAKLSEEDNQCVIEKIKKISTSENQKEAIEDAINTASNAASNSANVSVDMNFACDVSFIYNFLQQTVTEIVMQVLSPKVTMLYAINSAIMGDIANIQEWKNNFTYRSFDELFAKLTNLIETMIKQCLDLIIKELFKFLMDKIGPIIKIFTMQLLLETIRDYKDLILQLITVCGLMPFRIASLYDGEMKIDNVDYADIVPMKTAPGNNDC